MTGDRALTELAGLCASRSKLDVEACEVDDVPDIILLSSFGVLREMWTRTLVVVK